MYTRRKLVHMLAVGAGIGSLGMGSWRAGQALAADASVDVGLLGYSLAIHVPAIAAVETILPSLRNKEKANVVRMEQARTLTQSIISGQSQFGEGDFLSFVHAANAGADLVAIGNFYLNTSFVLVVNADVVSTVEDLLKPDVIIAVNGNGDTTHLCWVGALINKGIDPTGVQLIEMGGSGSRLRALLSGRIAGCPMHFDQASEVMKTGNFKVLVEPWTVYDPWLGEVWITSRSSLKHPETARAAVDLLKANLIAFRKANDDFGWYAEMYRTYATVENAGSADDAAIRPIWEKLRDIVKAWPADMRFNVADAERLLPAYQAAGFLKGDIDFGAIIDDRYLRQAIEELKR